MTTGRGISDRWAGVVVWAVLAVACGIPMLWLVGQLLIHPQVLREAFPDAFREKLLIRTFGFTAIAATLSTIFAMPIALTLGLSRRPVSNVLWFACAVPLLMPSLVITYGWKQVHAVVGSEPMPQTSADVARCVFALSSFLWPVPAMVIAFALRRLDPALVMQARLDGATKRVLPRLIAGSIVLGWMGAMLLALQEFAIFEPTGISVIATEVRAVFETGASLDQSWSMLSDRSTQAQRMAAALAVMLPALLISALLAIVGWRFARTLSTDTDWHDSSPALRSPVWVEIFAWFVVLGLIGTPIVAMVASLHARFDPLRIANEYWPQIVGSSTLAISTAGVGLVLIVLASAWRISSRATWLALATFLIGGQWTAIALIVAFNRPWLFEIYDGPAMPILAYVGRFGWIALVAAGWTWSGGTGWLRDLAATDGAGRWQTWRHVIAPLAWPLLLGAAVLIFTLSLTEVPATTMLQPAGTLVPMLMTWAHILNYDAMIEASLLLAGTVIVASLIVVMLVRAMRGVK